MLTIGILDLLSSGIVLQGSELVKTERERVSGTELDVMMDGVLH